MVADYLAHKAGGIEPATLRSYEGHTRQIVKHLGNPTLADLPARLPTWVTTEVERLDGRRATVVKRLESIIKPAVRHAYAQHGLGVPFVFPELRSDYKAIGVRTAFLSREEFAALRAELPEVGTLDVMERDAGGALRLRQTSVVVYPRFYLDLATSTGLHDADLCVFRADYFDRAARTWYRANSKNAAHYRPEWLRCLPYMQEAIAAHCDRHGKRGRDRLVADGEAPLPAQWMRRRLIWAAARAGLCKVVRKKQSMCIVSGWAPAPIDLRRTCAQWRRAEGWTFDLTAKWLGNSSGIVAEVYAPTIAKDIDRAVAQSTRSSRNLIALTRDLEGSRKPPRGAGLRTSALHRSNLCSDPPTAKGATHGKQTIQGGRPTD